MSKKNVDPTTVYSEFYVDFWTEFDKLLTPTNSSILPMPAKKRVRVYRLGRMGVTLQAVPG